MKSLFFIVLLALSMNSSQAAIRAFIKVKDSFFLQRTVNVDGVDYNFITDEHPGLVDAFKSNKVSYEYMKNYKEDLFCSKIAIWGGLGVALTYLSTAKVPSVPLYTVILLTGIFTGASYESSALRNFHKGINTYNGIDERLTYGASDMKKPLKLGYSWSF